MNKHNRNKLVGYIGLALLAALAVISLSWIAAHAAGTHWLSLLGALMPDSTVRALDFGHWTSDLTPALAALPLVFTEQESQEITGLMSDLKDNLPALKRLPVAFKDFQDENAQLRLQLDDLRRQMLVQASLAPRRRMTGHVSDECARRVAAAFVAHCEKSGTLDALCSERDHRDALLNFSRSELGLATRAALTTGDIPLPTEYGGEIRELISEFGVVRRRMFHYPIGLGTARPARMGSRPSFGSVAMSVALPEKSPTLGFASLESHKIGGIVRLPREIDEQSIVSMGRFLARYGAVEFARAEDTWGFLADGTAGYESVKGIVQIARDNNTTVSLASGKTKPSDAALDDFRAVRRKVSKAALNGRLSAYYLDSTWETRLPSLKTSAEPNVYQRLPDGSAILDGYPIVWTDVLEPYGTAASADKPIAVFGALSFWWLGEHGTPRIDPSAHVFFANDQLAVRFIEEIDFDYAAPDATAVLLTAAS